MEVFGAVAESRFERELRDLFVGHYPRETAQAGGSKAMLAWVRLGMRLSREAGYATQFEIGRWLALMMMLGAGFDQDPQLPWVRPMLDEAAESDATVRIDNLFAEAVRYLQATAGRKAEYVVRALLRVQAVDFAALPALPDDEAVADACRRLAELYPRKSAFQGPELTAANTARQRLRARAMGLAGAAGEFLFVVLAFMLGEGFDNDPLHPWAREILHPAAGKPADDLAARLETAARAHLALSLTGT